MELAIIHTIPQYARVMMPITNPAIASPLKRHSFAFFMPIALNTMLRIEVIQKYNPKYSDSSDKINPAIPNALTFFACSC